MSSERVSVGPVEPLPVAVIAADVDGVPNTDIDEFYNTLGRDENVPHPVDETAADQACGWRKSIICWTEHNLR